MVFQNKAGITWSRNKLNRHAQTYCSQIFVSSMTKKTKKQNDGPPINSGFGESQGNMVLSEGLWSSAKLNGALVGRS